VSVSGAVSVQARAHGAHSGSASRNGSCRCARHCGRWFCAGRSGGRKAIYHPIAHADLSPDLNIRSGESIAAWIACDDVALRARVRTRTPSAGGLRVSHGFYIGSVGPTCLLFARRLNRTLWRRPTAVGRGANTAPPPSPRRCSRPHRGVSTEVIAPRAKRRSRAWAFHAPARGRRPLRCSVRAWASAQVSLSLALSRADVHGQSSVMAPSHTNGTAGETMGARVRKTGKRPE